MFVDLEPMIRVCCVHRTEDIGRHIVTLQQLPRCLYAFVGGSSLLIDTIGVVHRWRAVERQTYQHVFRCEKLTPLVVEQRAIGLQREFKDSLRAGDLLGFGHKAAVKIDAHQCGFAALKRDRDFASAVCLDELGQIGRDEIIRHSKAVAGIQLFLRQEEAVGAIKIADCTSRFCEHVERRRKPLGPGWRQLRFARAAERNWLTHANQIIAKRRTLRFQGPSRGTGCPKYRRRPNRDGR